MADDATDSAFGLVMFLLFLGLIAYAVGSTGTTSGSTTKTTTPTYTTPPSSAQPAQTDTNNMPGGPLSSCSSIPGARARRPASSNSAGS